MTILFDTPRPVKSARPFGRGILRSLPVYRDEVSQEDRQWWAEECARVEAEQAADKPLSYYFPLLPENPEHKGLLADCYRAYSEHLENERLEALYAARVAEDCLTRGLDPSSDPEYRGAWGGHPAFENF
jgi:hypothetical protein